ncbi:citrate transporter [Burkholderia sp. WAC0059]|uniref:SLC13 family permease n=1 Tax=Burkholderia sp. WAC0059 TaxID=2066022 RepID=UPI000C7EDEC0|nr:SLC13 family permease [Burkholderia sp. WAC0059]PLZ01995.1 citrate transporter [Burkholderia sp. WAC0059]
MTPPRRGVAYPARILRVLAGWAAREPVLAILAIALALLQALHPRAWASLPALVDWQTVATLAGLLVLTRALEYSGCLSAFAQRLTRRLRSERALAFALIALAAALSTVLTNDVALFVVVPLTLSLHRLSRLPIKRFVIFLALAVNAGSVLTPLGNPQNLFLWQSSGVSFGRFVLALAPLAALLLAMLAVLTACAFRARPLALREEATQPAQPVAVDGPLTGVALLLFVAFVMLADAHRVGLALPWVIGVFAAWRPRIVMSIDWLLLLIFVLMFVILRSVVALPSMHAALGQLGLGTPLRAYVAAAVLSQGISNVPATILLSSFTPDWRSLGFGVSVGGFGCAIGSLANLIAVRLAKTRGMWLPFHLVSIPFGLVALMLGALLLQYG